MKLVHFTASPLRFGFPAGTHRRISRHDGMKPRGFWVSDEDDFGWLEWSKGEHFRLDHFKHAYEVKLIDDPGMIWLKTPEDIDKFTDTFGLQDDLYRALSFNGKGSIYRIDWQRLQPLANGILITPYQWKRRLDGRASWYYSWDCASGVIWNTKAIASITEIEPPDLTEALAEKAKRDEEHAAYLAENGWKDDHEMMRGMTEKLVEASEQRRKEREAKEAEEDGAA